MYLERVKAKGKTYLYLRKYAVRDNYCNNSMTVYRFGRIDNALRQMYKWQKDFSEFPEELKKEGCKKKDLSSWINTLESGLHPTGRSFTTQYNIYNVLNG